MFSFGRKPVRFIVRSSRLMVASSVKTPSNPGSLKSIKVFRNVAELITSIPTASR